jgi:hypothetical protein
MTDFPGIIVWDIPFNDKKRGITRKKTYTYSGKSKEKREGYLARLQHRICFR